VIAGGCISVRWVWTKPFFGLRLHAATGEKEVQAPTEKLEELVISQEELPVRRVLEIITS
jgi:hypothetical protein